jgi:hypothetical protein
MEGQRVSFIEWSVPRANRNHHGKLTRLSILLVLTHPLVLVLVFVVLKVVHSIFVLEFVSNMRSTPAAANVRRIRGGQSRERCVRLLRRLSELSQAQVDR